MNDSISTYLWKCTTLGYWSNGVYYEWYIPAIVTLYIVYPFMYKFLFRKETSEKLIFLFIIIFMMLSLVAVNISDKYCDNWHYLLLYRVPIFLYGTYIASVILKGTYFKFPHTSVILFLIGGILFIFGRKFDSLRLVYLSISFCIPLLIMILCICFSRFKRIARIASWIGAVSLEIYLLHIVFLKLNGNGNLLFLQDLSNDMKVFVICLSTVLLSVGVKSGMNRLFTVKL